MPDLSALAWAKPVLGIISGFLFGVVLQRGRVCFNSAFRDLRLTKDNYMFKAGLLTVAILAIGHVALAQFGLIKLSPAGISFVSMGIGGLLFGLGMVLAGGCASGTTYRIGEGFTTSILAGLVYGIFAIATSKGFLSPITKALSNTWISIPNPDPTIYAGEKIGHTISTILGINPWIAAIGFAGLIGIYLFATKTTKRDGANMKWWVISILLAAVSLITYVLSAMTGRQGGLAITAGWANLLSAIMDVETKVDFLGGIIIGIILGALVAAVASKEFKLRAPKQAKYYIYAVLGGMLMGFGAMLTRGCNIGHFITGNGLMSLGSLYASAMFIIGNWIMVRILFGKAE